MDFIIKKEDAIIASFDDSTANIQDVVKPLAKESVKSVLIELDSEVVKIDNLFDAIEKMNNIDRIVIELK